MLLVEIIYEQLKTPKSVEELHQRLNEAGVKWNKAQLQLLLLMIAILIGQGIYTAQEEII